MPTSIAAIDLRPIYGKQYFEIPREWREEFIYFLMVDRFHDGMARDSVDGAARSIGFSTGDDFHGGSIKGITQNLDYIAGLGCTSIWLSPIFENNAHAYHGYNINNYLDVDPHFGTKQDLIDLVEAAQARNPPMRIVLDVVINHSGDNWSYPGNDEYRYAGDQQFPFGFWRRADRPIPTELRQEHLYHRRGAISSDSGWDEYPEDQHGDIVTLKDFANDDDAAGSEVINILIKAHCYWIRETDIDGFRVDAVKHMGEVACSGGMTGTSARPSRRAAASRAPARASSRRSQANVAPQSAARFKRHAGAMAREPGRRMSCCHSGFLLRGAVAEDDMAWLNPSSSHVRDLSRRARGINQVVPRPRSQERNGAQGAFLGSIGGGPDTEETYANRF
jgi:hypothetical protein